MMESETDKHLAWTFLAASTSLPLFIVFIISVSVLGSHNHDLYGRMYPVLNPLTRILVVILLASQVVCAVCAIVACAGTKFRTLKRPQWWVGGIMLIVLWLAVAAAIAILPHPPSN